MTNVWHGPYNKPMPTYRINLILSDDDDINTAIETVWPLDHNGFIVDNNDHDAAEMEFERLQDVGEYLKLHGKDETLHPLVLLELPEPDSQNWEGTELDRFWPALIMEGECFDIDNVAEGYGSEGRVEVGNREYVVFADSDAAGKAAAEYWRDMADNDRREFVAMIGEERLVGWALGESDSFGISSLEEFCEVSAKYPEEHHASYDGYERDVDRVSSEVVDLLGFTPTVAYRRN